MGEMRSLADSLPRVLARGPDTLAIVPEEPRRGAPDDNGDDGEDRVALAVPERVVHRRREQREAEARARPQECYGRERGGCVQGEGVDDIRLDALEVEDRACTY